MSSEDFVKNVNRVQYARSFGVAWKKVTQWHHFATGKLTAKANQDFKPKAKDDDEIELKKGETVKIVRISAGKSWRTAINASGAEGFVRSRMLDIDPNRACAKYCLSNNHTGKTECVVTLTQKNVKLARKFHYSKDKQMNVKDTSYADMNIYVVDQNDRMVMKRNGSQRCLWMEMEIDPSNHYRIYCLSSDGLGAEFSLRVYTKGRGEAHLTGDGEGKLTELMEVLKKCP